MIASIDFDLILKHPTASITFDSTAHLTTSPHKKPLKLFSTSCPSLGVEKSWKAALLPYRRPLDDVNFKRRDSVSLLARSFVWHTKDLDGRPFFKFSVDLFKKSWYDFPV